MKAHALLETSTASESDRRQNYVWNYFFPYVSIELASLSTNEKYWIINFISTDPRITDQLLRHNLFYKFAQDKQRQRVK